MFRIWACLFLFVLTKAEGTNETSSVFPPMEGVGVCGNRLYSTKSFLCCEGNVILPKPTEHIKCCAAGRYDSRYYICCYKFVVFGKHAGCCADRYAYDDRSHLCCDGKVIQKLHPKAYCCHGKLCIGPNE